MMNRSKKKPLNLYSWTTEKPTHVVERKASLDDATSACVKGEGAFVLLGTRGMGKSVFLAHLYDRIAKIEEFEAIRFDRPPLSKTILEALVAELIAKASGPRGSEANESFAKRLRDLQAREKIVEIFEEYLNERSGSVERVVLMYDELDAYAETHRAKAGRDYFDALEAARKKLDRRLFIVAAGGGGMLALKTILGSSIFSRESRTVLEPFDRDELIELAEPFRQLRGQELSDDIIDALLSLSGGNLALATYGLQELWEVDEPSLLHLTRAFNTFFKSNSSFISSIRGAIFGFDKSEIPYHVWRHFKTNGGQLAKLDFATLRSTHEVESKVANEDILDMLRAAGLVRIDPSARNADPIPATLIPSILSFDDTDTTRKPATSLQEQLRNDLWDVMALIHQWAPSFYRPKDKSKEEENQLASEANSRPGSKAKNEEEKQLVPEAIFAANIAVYLTAKGWRANLESMSGAGFADIKAEHPRFSNEEAIIEVKIWKRKVETIHNQITSYFAHGVKALATLVIGETQEPTWKDDYETTCLKGKVDGDATWKPLDRPWEGYFEAQWESRVVEHFLLRLPKRS